MASNNIKDDIVERIRKVMKILDITQPILAERAGISQSYISQMFRGACNLNLNQLLPALYEVNSEWILTGEGVMLKKDFKEPTLVQIPLLGKVAAGKGANEEINEYITIPKVMLKHVSGDFFALQVAGDSMVPTLHDGDIAVFRSQPTLENGQTGAFRILEKSKYIHLIKKYQVVGFEIALLSTKDGSLRHVQRTDEMTIMGLLVFSCRHYPID